MKHDFDVALDPWIPCRAVDGRWRLVSLRDALREATDIEAIETSRPLEAISIYRILLAAVHGIVGGPRDVKERQSIYERGSFDHSLVDSYFERWKDRFGLFDALHPFLQTPGLSVVDKFGLESPLPVETVIPDSIINKTLFNHHSDARPLELDPAEALRVLLMLQYYGLPGLAKKKVNIGSIGEQYSFFTAPLLPGIATMLSGPNLFETLCLNLVIYNDTEPLAGIDPDSDAPAWEREPSFVSGNRQASGYLDYLVPISRHARLVPEASGDKTVVRAIHVTQGTAFKHEALEPMFHKARSKKDKSLYIPKASEEKALWRESAALFAFASLADENPDNHGERPKSFSQFAHLRSAFKKRHGSMPLGCESFALLNDKASPLLWRNDRLAFPETALSDANTARTIGVSIDLADSAGSCVFAAISAFARTSLGNNPAGSDVSNLRKSTGAEALYWAALEPPFKLHLASLGGSDEAWRDAIRSAALDAYSTCIESRSASGTRFYAALAAGKQTLESGLAKILPRSKGGEG
ncbi:MAG: type I-E CRISPR-associated protein Cse1/CasA [Spirochaetes bacterium]|nr:type I-E CRISPR-associated protein Cse1/CasA [Spirochaetota bacterium]MBU1079919.1 type I-E CRISPR-associated protein Cse1/CasA [Spirochaetota bacterium]